MILNVYIWEGIKKSMQNIESTPGQSAVQAELKATKVHLEDMRSLVFKKDK